MAENAETPDEHMRELLVVALADAHVAESARLVQAAMQVVPVPPVVQPQAAGFSTSAN